MIEKTNKILGYLAIFAVVLALSLGGFVGQRRQEFVIYDYTKADKKMIIEEKDHSSTDKMVRNAVKLYYYYRMKDEAYAQLYNVYRVDSTYWVAVYCKAMFLDEAHAGIIERIKTYEKAWALKDEPSAEFDAGGHIYFTEYKLLDRLTDLYLAKYNWTRDDYDWYQYEGYREAAKEIKMKRKRYYGQYVFEHSK